ncbi:MAG: DUF4445 domain-containing protein [Phycisphaeraceae bacterium]|nr:DUF4445 domain-containing protein [Phycisphaeraceae bacterium]
MSQPLDLWVQAPGEPQPWSHVRIDAKERDRSLADILRRQDWPLNTRCGQRGICQGCVIDLVEGSLVSIRDGSTLNRSADATGDPTPFRGCDYRAGTCDTLRLHLPLRSMLAYEPQVVSDFSLQVSGAKDPLIRTTTSMLGAAVDIGTTTVVVMLVDLITGEVVARAAGFNRQMHLGDDVLTRINLCMTDPAMIRQLQKEVVENTLAPLLRQALQQAGVDANGSATPAVAGMTVAANTTMLHLLVGEDPSPMGMVPFTPKFLDHRVHTGASLGLDNVGEVHLLPGASAYVGADLCAGAIVSGLSYDDGPSLLVDVGTNGEILLKQGDQIWCCATAAGPAFEGAGLSSGIRAGDGAVSHYRFEDGSLAPIMEVIGAERPGARPGSALGICGSGYVDFLAQARRVNLLTPAGRFNDPPPIPLTSSIIQDADHGRAYRIAQGQGRRDILISETDIARLLQAKAAIAAGILTLLDRVGLQPSDVKTLYLAGGFGMHMDIVHAIACGLLPGFTPHQIKLVGNSSLGGAYMALVDRGLLPELARLGRSMQVIELNLDPGFEDRYIDQLSLP